MGDQFITDTSTVFDIGQTVVAKVTNLDEEKNRFLVSLRVSELSLSGEGSQARLIQGLKERKAIFEMMTCRGMSAGSDECQMIRCLTSVFCCILVSLIQISKSLLSPGESDVLQQLSAVSLGNKLKVTVGDNREDGSVALTSDQLSEATVLVSKYHTEGEDCLPLTKINFKLL